MHAARPVQPEKLPTAPAVEAARPVAAEDLRVGDYVTVAHTHYQVLLIPDGPGEHHAPRVERLTARPRETGRPRKVVGIALPYLLVELINGKHATLDLRAHALLKLPKAYGQLATQRLKANRPPKDDAKKPKKRKKHAKGKKRK
ncbi:MAG: hypothetical protein AAGI68_13510 [Planctomycetota bacterium]